MNEHPVIGFGIAYNEDLIYCEAIMHDNYYDILFNGNWIASIALNGDDLWMQESGVILPQQIIDEIGEKIEKGYE